MSRARAVAVDTPADGAEVARIVSGNGWTVAMCSGPLATFCDPWRGEIPTCRRGVPRRARRG